MRAKRRRVSTLLSARKRAAHGQVPQRRAVPGIQAAAKTLSVPKLFTPENLERYGNPDRICRIPLHSLLELAFSWLAARPEVCSVIAGAKTPDQVRANSRAASWKLSPEDLAQIDGILGEA